MAVGHKIGNSNQQSGDCTEGYHSGHRFRVVDIPTVPKWGLEIGNPVSSHGFPWICLKEYIINYNHIYIIMDGWMEIEIETEIEIDIDRYRYLRLYYIYNSPLDSPSRGFQIGKC